jgi:2-keto-4-pentenoate hydratase
MTYDIAQLATELDLALRAARPTPSVLGANPDLTPAQAYQLQLAIAERKGAEGDQLLGHETALTSAAMQAQIGVPEPMLSTLLASRDHPLNPRVSLRARRFVNATLEPEIAIVMREHLAGPGGRAGHGAHDGVDRRQRALGPRRSSKRALQSNRLSVGRNYCLNPQCAIPKETA